MSLRSVATLPLAFKLVATDNMKKATPNSEDNVNESDRLQYVLCQLYRS